jgi:hypothetical protein
MIRHIALFLLVLPLLFFAGCVVPPPSRSPQRPSPCMAVIAPIRYTSIVVSVNINTTYNAKDLPGARQFAEPDVIKELSAQSTANGDGNTFNPQNGQASNLTYNYSVSNDGNGHFTGSLSMYGWGVGFIHTFYTQYPYTEPYKMLEDLTDQSYSYIHGGWHDARPNCPH